MKNKDMKIIDNYTIFYNNIDAGYIRLIQYYDSLFFHLEFKIKEQYRQKGLMTQHLPIYLQELKDKNITTVIAVVEKKNLVSKKILEKNKFTKINLENKKFAYFTKALVSMIEVVGNIYKIK